MEHDSSMDVPTPRPDQGTFGESLKFKMRRARVLEMERQQEIQDHLDIQMTEEQYQILVGPFASVKFEGCDLDGLSWSDPKWKGIHALWNAEHPLSLDIPTRPRCKGRESGTAQANTRCSSERPFGFTQCPEMTRTVASRGFKVGRRGILADEAFTLRTSASMPLISTEPRNSGRSTIRPPRRRPTSLKLFDAYIQSGSPSTTDVQRVPGLCTPRSPHLREAGCLLERGLRSPLRPKRYSVSAVLDRHFPLSEEERRRRIVAVNGGTELGETVPTDSLPR